MNLAVLRVAGSDCALQTLQGALTLKPRTSWRKSESNRAGRVHESSGFAATIADAPTPRELVTEVRTFLNQCQKDGIDFAASGLESILSVGITVGDSKQFVASVDWSPTDLLLMGSLGIALSVTAYPTSDEANEPDFQL